MKSITVVGCGVMGSRLINAMMNAGVKPVIVDLNKAAAEPFIARGAKYAPTLAEAEDTDGILLNLPHHGIARKVILDCPKEKLAGKMLINTTTSTSDEVLDMDKIAKERGMKHLDAKIMCYPGDIGTGTGGLVYSGPREVFDAFDDPVFKSFGHHGYLGEEIILAVVTDIGVCNVHFGAIGSLLEATSYCLRKGCDLDTFINQIRIFLPMMFEGNLRAFAEELKDYDGNFVDVTECKLGIETTAIDTFRRAINGAGVETPLGDALYDLFKAGVDAGYGKKNVVAVVNEIMK